MHMNLVPYRWQAQVIHMDMNSIILLVMNMFLVSLLLLLAISSLISQPIIYQSMYRHLARPFFPLYQMTNTHISVEHPWQALSQQALLLLSNLNSRI